MKKGALLVAALVVAFSPLMTTPAEAASTCKGTACEGRDPHTYACDKDGSNIAEFTLNNHRTILRYSKKCDAWWTLATPSPTGPVEPVEVRSYNKVYSSSGPHYEYRKKYGTYVSWGGNTWTKMVAGRYSARACEYDLVPEYSGGDRKLYCTAYH